MNVALFFLALSLSLSTEYTFIHVIIFSFFFVWIKRNKTPNNYIKLMMVAFSTRMNRKVWNRDGAWKKRKKEMIFIEKVETSRKICKCAITTHIVVAFNFCSFFSLSPFLTRSLLLWNEHNSSSFLLRFSHFIFNRLVVLAAFCLLLWLLRLFMFIRSHAITRHKRCTTSCILLPLLLQLNYVSLNQYNRIKSECVLCTHLHIVFLHVNCICMWFNVNVLNMHIFTQFFYSWF